MADIYGSHFEYAGRSSIEFGLVVATVESDRMRKRAGDIEAITIFSKLQNRRILVSDNTANSPLTFDVEIISVDGKAIEYDKRRKVEKWLFNRHSYCRFYIDPMDDPYCETYEFVDGKVKRNYLNCRFINAEKLEYDNGVVGYRATLEADSCMFWQDETVARYALHHDDPSITSIITVNVDTDLDEYIYPKITLQVGGYGGDITIINNTDDNYRETKFVDLPPLATITMKGELNYISGLYYDKFVKANFIRLLDGENKFFLKGDVDIITYEFHNRRAF